jgi:hypothetical protein
MNEMEFKTKPCGIANKLTPIGNDRTTLEWKLYMRTKSAARYLEKKDEILNKNSLLRRKKVEEQKKIRAQEIKDEYFKIFERERAGSEIEAPVEIKTNAAAESARRAADVSPENYYERDVDGQPIVTYNNSRQKIINSRIFRGDSNSGTMQTILNALKMVFQQGLGGLDKNIWPFLLDVDNKLRPAILKMEKVGGGLYAVSGARNFASAVYNLILNLHIPIPADEALKLNHFWLLCSVRSDLYDFQTKKMPQDSVLNFDILMQRADALAITDSEPVYNVVVHMWNEVCFRAELVSILLVESLEDTVDKNKNYIILSERSAPVSYQINIYKTSQKYGVLQGEFSQSTSKMIRRYASGREYGKRLFDFLERDLKILLEKVGARTEASSKMGVFNLFRHSVLSTRAIGCVDNWTKLETLVKLIETARNNSNTTIQKYLYKTHN